MNTELKNKDLTSNDAKPVLAEVAKCQSCNKNNGKELHTCPFKEDINNDYDSLCNCCSECRYECCMDI